MGDTHRLEKREVHTKGKEERYTRKMCMHRGEKGEIYMDERKGKYKKKGEIRGTLVGKV